MSDQMARENYHEEYVELTNVLKEQYEKNNLEQFCNALKLKEQNKFTIRKNGLLANYQNKYKTLIS